MTQEEKKPVPPESSYPELEDEGELDEAELEELIQAVSEPETSGQDAAEDPNLQAIAKLQKEIEIQRQQVREKEENYLRLYADFDNFRKRTKREKEDLSWREKQKVLLDILPIVDNFERAQQTIKLETDRETTIHDSYQSVYRLLVEALKKMGVSRMRTVGESFDPNLHEAMMQQPTTEHSEGTILQEFQPGYMLDDTVLRHAMVIVAASAAGGDESPPAVTEEAARDAGTEDLDTSDAAPEEGVPSAAE